MNICTAKTIERIIRLCFALNSTYSPLYLKWLHREFAKLPELAMDIGPLALRAQRRHKIGLVTRVMASVHAAAS